MKVAVIYQDGLVFGHFNYIGKLKIYEIEKKKITGTKVVFYDDSEKTALLKTLKSNKVRILICSVIDEAEKKKIQKGGIRIIFGVMGSADKAVEKYLKGRLRSKTKVPVFYKKCLKLIKE